MARELDFSALAARPRTRDRLRDVRSNNGLVLGAVIGVVLLGTGVPGLVVRLSAGTTWAGEDVVWLFVLLTGCGLFLVVGLFRQTGHGAGLARFAEANDLESLEAGFAPHYAGSVFAAGLHTVNDAVRTRGPRFVEVGERFPTGEPTDRSNPRRQMVYLRARLSGRVAPGSRADDVVTPDLRDALERWAGEHHVEVADDELTVLGSRPLQARRPGRVEEGFRLVDALVARAEAELALDRGPAVPVPTRSGVPVPVREAVATPGRVAGPLRVVGGFLVLLVVVSFGFAVVMSVLDDLLPRTRVVASLVVGVLVALVTALVGRWVRSVMTPRPRSADTTEAS